MTLTLAQLIERTQTQLGDDGTIFTDNAVTNAIRQALNEFNNRAPQHLATLLDGVSEQYEYELSDDDPDAMDVYDVLLQGDNGDELDEPINFKSFVEDERVWIRLENPVSDGDTLIVRYTKGHTITNLDSATDSTLLARHDQVIVDGASYWALTTRAVSRVETINLSKDQSDNYREIMQAFRNAFELGMQMAARKLPAVGEPDESAWNDEYHSWEQ